MEVGEYHDFKNDEEVDEVGVYKVAGMVVDMEVDKVTHEVANMVSDMVVNMEVDKVVDEVAYIVVDMEVDKVADMVVDM